MSKEVDTVDQLITGEEGGVIQMSQLEFDTLKFTLDTITEVMKDMNFKLEKLERKVNDMQGELNILKSPLAGKKVYG